MNGHLSRDGLRTDLAQKESEIASLETKANELREDIRAIKRVLGMYPNGAVETKALAANVQVSASELRGKRTQMEALDYIAEKHSGRIKVNIAKQLLIGAGLTKGNPKYVYGHIYNMLKGDERYEPIGDGEFQKKQGSLALR